MDMRKLLSFQFEPLIMAKIESYVESYLTAKFPEIATTDPIKPVIQYLNFEPSQMQVVTTKFDGIIAISAREIPFINTTETADQETQTLYEVFAYGVGDPIEDINNSGEWQSSVEIAQERGEILTSLIFDAIMDRTEKEIKFQPEIAKDDKLDFTEKVPISIKKFSPLGAEETNRGVCIYRSMYKLRFDEEPPTEPLGVVYTGSNIEQPTTNP